MINVAVSARADTYAEDLKAFVSTRASTLLTNDEFAIVAPALIIAFLRQAAACAVAYGETFGAEPAKVLEALGEQFGREYWDALGLVREPRSVQ